MVELKNESVKILLSLHDVYGRGDLAPTGFVVKGLI